MTYLLMVIFATTGMLLSSCKKNAATGDKDPRPKMDLDFKFSKSISEEVLKNYLSRSITYSLIGVPSSLPLRDNAVITTTGAKYVSRAVIRWEAEDEYDATFKDYKTRIAQIHALDSDVIVEACIFETVYPSANNVVIPDWVFEAFGEPVQERNFRHEAMLFPDGRYVNHWDERGSVPDISQLETQMYFYFRACRYIEAGFGAIHWGQVTLMGETDPGYRSFYGLLGKVRDFAAKHGRRGFVLNNAHTHGIVNEAGELLFDFHTYPARIKPAANSVSHAPSNANPQEAVLESNYIDAIYGKSKGGKTPSGWTCDKLPYFVEVDNYGGHSTGQLHNPNLDYWPWGMDEISWYVNQPKAYRDFWLKYAYEWVRNTDDAGFLCLPASRPYYSLAESRMTWYFCHDASFNDQSAIKNVWIDSAN